MGRYKCAYNCDTSNDSETKFFKFPLYNPRKLKKWLTNMKWKDWTPTRFSVLCINHFEEQYLERKGKSVTLREDAVPTIFTSTDDPQTGKVSVNTRRKRQRAPGAKASEKEAVQSSSPPPSTTKGSIQNDELNQNEQESPGDKKTEKWRIIVDEWLLKIESFPHFFHGDYCVPEHNIQWAPDNELSVDCNDSENTIEVDEPWQWLAMDVRGPLPQTANGHKYILTVTDYYSKWVEAVPMQMCLSSHVVKSIADIITDFGYPLRILSRLPHDIVHKVNRELKDLLKIDIAVVVHHQQTGTLDSFTPLLIDRMVSELAENHAADWDVYLPAKVFSLCFKEHSKTRERPFSLLFCKGREPVKSPRGLNYSYFGVKESVFVVTQKINWSIESAV